ncbi:MAG: lysophospholipid acyltransferase family protein [Polyangiaceae bacterium]|nr:lysophospholipid acyltransferase family protein [Polyangiaceae bacterium]
MYGPDAFVRLSPMVFGLAFGAALHDVREHVMETHRRALGPRPKHVELADAAGVFMNFACSMADAFAVAEGRKHLLIAERKHDEHFTQALNEGRGVIAATAHTGGWQVAGALVKKHHPDADMVIVMNRERDERAQRIQDAARDQAGIRILHVGRDPLDAMPVLAHLRKGGVVAVQIDRIPNGMRRRKVQFFGQPWAVPEGPLLLSALSGAPIVPSFTRRLGYLSYDIFSHPPVRIARKPKDPDLDAAAQALADAMADFVRTNPTQWFHFDMESRRGGA